MRRVGQVSSQPGTQDLNSLPRYEEMLNKERAGSSSGYTSPVELLQRITRDPAVMGGRPCIRGMRVTVGTIVGLLAAGRTQDEILRAYPYLEPDDIRAALSYAAWRAEEIELPLP
jgi:uncharacterized protein (DUF433 family)